MENYLPMRSETITLLSDVEIFNLSFNKTPKTVIVQVLDKDGNVKVIKFKDNVISPSGKTATLKKGDVITYMAVF